MFDGTGQRLATMVSGNITSVSVYDATGMLVAEYGSSTTNGTQYLVSDHQGTPRVVTSATGTIISRHDYLPFGEEVAAGVGMRVSGQGYGGADGVQKKYAGMESDSTGMAHTLWRKYDQLSGRWTTTDPYGGSMTIADPQSFNRYTYVNNDPVNCVDPTGLSLADMGVLQTDDPKAAQQAEHDALNSFRTAINEQYQAQHNWILQEAQTAPMNLPNFGQEAGSSGGLGAAMGQAAENSGAGEQCNGTACDQKMATIFGDGPGKSVGRTAFDANGTYVWCEP